LSRGVPFPRLRKSKRALVCIALVATFIVVAWFGREFWLREAAELWIVSAEIGPADAVAVLGGALSVRPMAAADYYHRGLVKKVLVANVHLDQSEELGIVPSHSTLIHGALIKVGVPETAIEGFGNEVTNTYQEVMALREWVIGNRVHSVIVPTEVFSSRRVRWILEHELAGTGVKVQVSALDPTNYGRDQWWHNDQGPLNFQNEVIKYVYYRFRYCVRLDCDSQRSLAKRKNSTNGQPAVH
jgi:uncharacterized SAM-binding protein YcdF (DUF218 family)